MSSSLTGELSVHADKRRSILVLILIALSSFLATFNETFLNVALSPLMRSFSVDALQVQWVSTAYMLVAAIMVPFTGFLFQRFRITTLVRISLGFLILGSLICALAPWFSILIAGRACQAIGTGMLIPLGMNLTLIVAPRNKIGTYMGIVSSMTTLGPAFGPIAAGIIMSFTNWPGLFLVFGVLSFGVLLYALVALKPCTTPQNIQLDILSTILACVALMGIMYGVSQLFGGHLQNGGICLGIGLVALVIFVVRQKRCAHPLLNLAPLSCTSFNLGVITVMCALMIVFSTNMVLPIFMQEALGFTPLKAALTLLFPCLISCVLAPVAGKIFDTYGLRIIAPVGMMLIACCSFALSKSSVDTTPAMLIALYAPIIVGCALVIGPSQSFALSQLDPRLYPHGTTIVGTSFQLAGCLGSSVFMGLYARGGSAASSQGLTPALMSVHGFQLALMGAVVLALVGLGVVCALSFCERRISSKQSAAERSQSVQSNDLAAVQSDTEGTEDALNDLRAQDVMLTQVYAIQASQSAFEALQLMMSHKVSGLPVLNEHEQLVGFIADGDILRALTSEHIDHINMSYVYALWAHAGTLATRLASLHEITVGELAHMPAVSLDVQTNLEKVCQTLSSGHIKKIPVTQGQKVVGVVTRTSLLHSMLALKRTESVHV